MTTITTDRILEAADQLQAEGSKVTQLTVRERLGSGSIATIAPALKRWREAQEARATREPMPARPRRRIEDVLTDVWQDAKEEAASAWACEKGELEAARQATVAELQETLEAATSLEAEIEAARQAQKGAEAALAAAEAARVEAEKQVKVIRAELEAEIRSIHGEKADLIAANNKLSGRLEALDEVMKALKPSEKPVSLQVIEAASNVEM